jgi:hypothetical protein
MSKKSQARANRIAKMKWPRTQAGWLARWKKQFGKIRHKATVLGAIEGEANIFGEAEFLSISQGAGHARPRPKQKLHWSRLRTRRIVMLESQARTRLWGMIPSD